MVAKYDQDSLRFWACTCDESEADKLKAKLVRLDLPENVTNFVWFVGEPEPLPVGIATWEHVVGLCHRALFDGVSGKDKERLDSVLEDMAAAVGTFIVRESLAVKWDKLIAAEELVTVPVEVVESVPEVVSEPSAQVEQIVDPVPEVVPVVETVEEAKGSE